MAGRSRHPAFGLKPFAGDNTNQVLETGGNSVAEIKSVGGTTDDYMMKVMSAQMEFGCDVIEATGEFVGNLNSSGTDTPISDTHMESLHQVKGQIALQGHALADDAIGLVNLEIGPGLAAADNSHVDIKFLLGVGTTAAATAAQKQYIKFRMVIESVGINWDIEQPFVGVSIRGRLSDQYGASGAPIQEAT